MNIASTNLHTEEGRRFGAMPIGASGRIRVAPLAEIPVLLAERGIDLALPFVQSGLDPHLLDDPENLVSYDALSRLLDACVELTGLPHFGLLVGRRFALRSLGVLGDLMRHSPTVQHALRMGVTYHGIVTTGAVSLSLEFRKARAFGYVLLSGHLHAAGQILDAGASARYLMLRELCGPDWKPQRVQLSHRRPEDARPFREFFGGADVSFDAELSAILFDPRWLKHAVAGADPTEYATALEAARVLRSDDSTRFSSDVRRALYSLILGRAAHSENVARLFNVSTRTLRRRLEEEGTTVRELLAQARRELSHHLLTDTDLAVARIAAALCYSGAAAFSRAFREWSGTSPSEWREAHGGKRRDVNAREAEGREGPRT